MVDGLGYRVMAPSRVMRQLTTTGSAMPRTEGRTPWLQRRSCAKPQPEFRTTIAQAFNYTAARDFPGSGQPTALPCASAAGGKETVTALEMPSNV